MHIGVGFLRCSFSEEGQCEGLGIRNGQKSDSRAFLYADMNVKQSKKRLPPHGNRVIYPEKAWYT